MLRVRPATTDDFESLKALARLAGPGFTSLQLSDDRLLGKLKQAEASFASDVSAPGGEGYLFMLEDMDTGQVVGVSGIKAQVGRDGPYFNYKLLRQTQSSKAVDRNFDMDMLVLVNEYSGASEVGTLFVKPQMRGTGAGRLISQVRYMFMATAPHRFSQDVISELRGHVTEDGKSVFWDAVGRPFFRMEFGEADEISAKTDNEFIVDLMPSYPIYVALLPKAAQDVIGRPHPAGVGAKKYLEAEGFAYQRMIDVFDGGPSMYARRDNLRTVRESKVLPAHIGPVDGGVSAIISNEKIAGFRAVAAQVNLTDAGVKMTRDIMDVLEITQNSPVRIWSPS